MSIVLVVYSSGVTWMKIRKAMNIIEFITHFPDEESCEIFRIRPTIPMF